MKVDAYLLVFHRHASRARLGLDVQRQGIRAWARQQGHKITSWSADEGIGGSNGLDNRDGLPMSWPRSTTAGRAAW
ncbi:MAG: hypothetical protein ACTHPS_10840 [Streptosporangiaceae bacterium]